MTVRDISLPVRLSARDRVTLVVLLTASFTLAVDFSILNVALPRIGRDVGIPTGQLQWISTSFALCAAGFTLFFGRVSDLAGRKRMFLIGMALLGVSSLCGGLAGEPVLLLAARVAQGIATAIVTPAALSLLTTNFAEGPARDRALGLNGALMAGGFTTGAILGGVFTDVLSWRWAFFVNVLVAVLVLAVAPAVLRENRAEGRPAVDIGGAATVTLGLVAVVYAAVTAGQEGWASPVVWGALAAAVALFAAFWLVERRVREPLVALGILRMRHIAWGNVAGALAFATETSLVFTLTLYLQEVLGIPPLGAGLTFAVLGAGTVLGGLLGPRLIAGTDARRTILLGFLAQGIATIPLVFVDTASFWFAVVLVCTFIGGVANLVAIVGYVVVSTSGLPDGQQGLATGLATMSQQVGIALGTPIMSAVIAAASIGGPIGILPGINAAIAVNAVLCFAGALVAVVGVRLPMQPKSHQSE